MAPRATKRRRAAARVGRDFDELMDDIEQEARRAGPKAVADYAAAGATYRLARQVFDLRKAAKLTRRQLAAKSGVRQADISRLEAGDANPTLATIAAVAYALGAEVTLAVEHGKRSAEPRAPRARPHGVQRTGVRAAARAGGAPAGSGVASTARGEAPAR